MPDCGCHPKAAGEIGPGLKKAIMIVAFLNLGYFFIEFIIARKIGSVSLFADSVDFLEDALVNVLILVALGWNAKHRSFVGMLLAGLILIPGISALWTAWQKLLTFVPPEPILLSLTAAGALVVNLSCALILARFRKGAGSMAMAAFLSARNDVLANVAIIAAGLLTAWKPSAWPDLIVGIAIAMMNFRAAKEVFEAAANEHRESKA